MTGTSEQSEQSARAALAVVRTAVLDAVAVLVPTDCLVCGADGRSLCGGCAATVAREASAPVVTTLDTAAGAIPLVAAAPYEGAVRSLLLAYKDRCRVDAARPLSTVLDVAVAGVLNAVSAAPGPPGPDAETSSGRAVELLVPPSPRSSRRRRGFAPVPLLLRRLGLRAAPELVRARRTADQIGLGRGDRAANLVGSMRARGPLDGRAFLVVDDVCTTGATLAEVARAVHAEGGSVLGAAVVARTARRLPRGRDSASVVATTPVSAQSERQGEMPWIASK